MKTAWVVSKQQEYNGIDTLHPVVVATSPATAIGYLYAERKYHAVHELYRTEDTRGELFELTVRAITEAGKADTFVIRGLGVYPWDGHATMPDEVHWPGGFSVAYLSAYLDENHVPVGRLKTMYTAEQMGKARATLLHKLGLMIDVIDGPQYTAGGAA